MWKYFPRNLRESFERRVTRKISRSDKTSGQDPNQPTCTLQARILPSATQHHCNNSSPEEISTPIRLKELGKCCSWEDQNIKRRVKTFGQNSKETCNIITKIIPLLTQHVIDSSSKECNVNQQKERKKCGWRKQRKEKQQESSWESGTHVEHTWLGALGWSSALVLGWYMIQPLCRFWILPCDKERKCHGKQRFGHMIGSRERRHRMRHETHYVSIVEALSKTALAQPLCIQPKQAEKSILLDEPDGPTSPVQVTNTPFEFTASEQVQVASVSFGPPTAEQAIDKAGKNFLKVHNSVVGDIDNRLGVESMEHGKHKEAVDYFTRAMQYENPAATYNLGICYEKGLGTSQDLKQAAKYYQLASDRGHATAMYNLGVLHVRGLGGLPVDCDRAQELFEKASALGQCDAKKALEMATGRNSFEQHKEKEIFYDESTSVLLQALGIVQNSSINKEPVMDEEPQQHNVKMNLMQENLTDYVTMSDVLQLDVKDLSQLIQDTIFKYKELPQK